MNKPKYLKLLAIVEEDYKPITGEVTFKEGDWYCENVMSIKLDEDFNPALGIVTLNEDLSEFIEAVLNLAGERSDE